MKIIIINTLGNIMEDAVFMTQEEDVVIKNQIFSKQKELLEIKNIYRSEKSVGRVGKQRKRKGKSKEKELIRRQAQEASI